MLNSSRKPGATRKAESYLSILCENLLAKSDFLASRKVRVYEYDRSQVVKKGSLEPRGVVTGKLLCSPMHFFSRNRCPYRGVNLPGFLRETRTRIHFMHWRCVKSALSLPCYACFVCWCCAFFPRKSPDSSQSQTQIDSRFPRVALSAPPQLQLHPLGYLLVPSYPKNDRNDKENIK